MANQLLVLPGNRLFNNGNIAAPGGTASLFLSGTTTPAAFLDAEGTSLGPTITANGLGQLPAAYGDGTIAYRLILKDKDGTELDGGDLDPFFFGNTGIAGPPGPGTDLALQVDANGAVGDGVTDDTTAIQSTINSAAASYRRVRFGAKTYIVTSLTIPDGMVVETAGLATRIKQKSGTGPDTPVITVTGSCDIGDISVEGQLGQAGDTTGEFNHGIFVDAASSFAAVKIGNVSAKNIRGDAVNFGTGTGVTLGDCQLGDVLLDNVYRNGVAAVGNVRSLRAGTVSKAPSATYGCGFKEVDIEADPGTGNTLGVYFHRVFGRFVGVNATDAADFCDAVEFGSLDLDPSYTPGCNPAFTTTPTNAIEMRACKSLKIGKLKVNGFTGGAIVPVSGASTVPLVITIDEADVTNCQQGGSSTDPYFGPGAGASIEYHIGSLNVTTNLATNRVFQSQTIGAVNIGRLTAALFTGSLFMDTVANGDIGFAEASVNGAGNGGTIFQGCTDLHLRGGNLTGNILNNTPTRVVIENVTATMATDYISGTVVNCEYNRVTLGGTYSEKLFYTNSPTPTLTVDASGNVSVINGTHTLSGSGGFNAGTAGYEVNGLKVVGPRILGWSLDTGTADRTAHATYAAGTTLTFSATYTQSELTALATRLAAVEAALQSATRTQKALKDDLHATAGHGLVGT